MTTTFELPAELVELAALGELVATLHTKPQAFALAGPVPVVMVSTTIAKAHFEVIDATCRIRCVTMWRDMRALGWWKLDLRVCAGDGLVCTWLGVLPQ